MTIPLGFQVGTGEPVEIPLAHLAVCGQTQSAGKRGVRAAVRTKIAGDLATYQATDAEVEAVYQAVLFEIATEAAAA